MLILLFYAGGEACACDTQDIVEIVPRVELKTIPSMPYYLAGTLNYGGIPIPVLDLCKLIANRDSSSSMHTRIIIFRNSHATNSSFNLMGLIAEKITETRTIEASKFVYSGLEIPSFPYLKGFFSDGAQTFQIFSLSIMFDYFVGLLKNSSEVVVHE